MRRSTSFKALAASILVAIGWIASSSALSAAAPEMSGGSVPCDKTAREYKITAVGAPWIETGSASTQGWAVQDAMNRLYDKLGPKCADCPDGEPCMGPFGMWSVKCKIYGGPWWDPHNNEWVVQIAATEVYLKGWCLTCEE